MSRISDFLRALKKVLLHTYVVAGRRLLKNTVCISLKKTLILYNVWDAKNTRSVEEDFFKKRISTFSTPFF